MISKNSRIHITEAIVWQKAGTRYIDTLVVNFELIGITHIFLHRFKPSLMVAHSETYLDNPLESFSTWRCKEQPGCKMPVGYQLLL